MKTVKDHALYRRMSEPLDSHAAANDAVAAFFDGLRKLREEHRIRDVLVSVQVAYKTDDGGETVGHSRMTAGNSLECLGMAAVTYGAMRSEAEQALATATRGRDQ